MFEHSAVPFAERPPNEQMTMVLDRVRQVVRDLGDLDEGGWEQAAMIDEILAVLVRALAVYARAVLAERQQRILIELSVDARQFLPPESASHEAFTDLGRSLGIVS